MVQESTLAYLSKEIGLGEYLQLGTGEKKNQGASKSSILADIFESFVAALYSKIFQNFNRVLEYNNEKKKNSAIRITKN